MKPIGVGVIGTGFMGKAHSIAYSASASVLDVTMQTTQLKWGMIQKHLLHFSFRKTLIT